MTKDKADGLAELAGYIEKYDAQQRRQRTVRSTGAANLVLIQIRIAQSKAVELFNAAMEAGDKRKAEAVIAKSWVTIGRLTE